MASFTLIWIGQVFSLLGSTMTGFALTVWAWQVTGQATALALVGFFGFVPIVLLSPVAGALVDRYSRKKIMMLADFAAGVPTVVNLLLYASGSLQVWHLFITLSVSGAFQAFHFPAYSAAVTMMISKKHYARASGMLSTANFASGIFAPVAAAALLAVIGIEGIMLIDIGSFLFAISLIALAKIPQPTATESGLKGKGSIWKESAYGFRYIYERSGLLGLQLSFLGFNLFSTLSGVLLAPMILARTADNYLVLASVGSAASVGGVVGSVIVSSWGGPKRKIRGLILGLCGVGAFTGLLGVALLGVDYNIVIWMAASFATTVFVSLANSSSQAIWQSKVAPDVQGRVFATRALIAQISAPVSMLIAGPLADRVFEPAMMPSGGLAATFGGLTYVGPGAGIALLFVITGILCVLIGVFAYLVPAVRNVEDTLPDHDAKVQPSPEVPEMPAKTDASQVEEEAG
jgi:MFS family permease